MTRRAPCVDLGAKVGSVELANPVMTAAGTAGHGAELDAYFDLSHLGAVVVKSVSAEPWPGNPPPRLHETNGGMLNSVGLQNRGVDAWLDDELPALLATGARVVASVWGFTVGDFAKVASALARSPGGVIAVEVNLSCPNLDGGRHVFAHSSSATAEVVAAVAGAALDAGAESLTLVNTVRGLAIDPETRRPRLGAGSGGLSGPAIRPVAVRAVYECRRAFPTAGIVGVGGIATGTDAVEMMLAGADAVQVGTATFADPRAPARVLAELAAWCRGHAVERSRDLIGGAHAHTRPEP